MLVALVSVLLVQLLAVQANILSHHEKPGYDIGALCEGKSINLSTYGQLKELAAKAEESHCTRRLKLAITELAKVIETTKDDLCSSASIDELVNYYREHVLSSWDPRKGKDPNERTDSVLRFAKAYALQVSKMCKMTIQEALSGQVSGLTIKAMDAETEEIFDKLSHLDGRVGNYLGELGNGGEIVMPGDTGAFLRANYINEESPTKAYEWVILEDTTVPFLNKIKAACATTFKPFYGPYMLPLNGLANLSVIYSGQELNSERAQEVGAWSRVASACEALETVEIVPKPSDSRSLGDALIQMREFEQARYESPVKVALDEDEPIFDKSNKNLVKLIKGLNIHPTERVTARSEKLLKMTAVAKRQKLKLGFLGALVTKNYEYSPQSDKPMKSSTSIILSALNCKDKC